MKQKLNTHILMLLFLFLTKLATAIPFFSPEGIEPILLGQDSSEAKLSADSKKINFIYQTTRSWILPVTSNSFSWGIIDKVKLAATSGSDKPSLLFNLNSNFGSTSSAGVATDLRFKPSIGVQYNWRNFGIGLDVETFRSNTEFDYNAYYQQFESFGFAVFESTRDKWKSTSFSAGPQYTLHFSPGRNSSAAKEYSAYGSASGATTKDLALTFSLKGGISINKSPDISIYDSTAPYIVIASYKAPDTYKKNIFNIKPGVAFTYWFNDRFGANVNASYMIVTGQNEFETGYRDLSKVNFDLNEKEVRFMVLRSPAVISTTKGPGNSFSFGAGVNVKFGNKKTSAKDVETQPTGNIPQNPVNENPPPSIVAAQQVDKKATDVPQAAEAKPEQQEKQKEQEKEKEYIRPSILSPADGAAISSEELKKSVVLKWTSVIPLPPAGNVVYHVKLYEVAEGQQAATVLKSGKAIFEKDISNATQTSFSQPASTKTSDKQSQFTWTVQATDRMGKPYGANNGTSDPSTFKISENDIDIAIDSLKVECCKDGKQLIKITIKNNLANTNTILKKIIITAVNGNFGSPQPLDISTLISPPLPFSFLPSSASASLGRKNFTASIDCNLNMNNLVVKAEGERSTAMGLVTDNDLESDTLNCICRECDKIKIEIPDKAQTSFSANTVSVISPVSVSPKKVKKITADIAYFSYTPESEDCAPCDKDSKTFGNFASASLTAPGFPSAALIPYGHEAIWNSNTSSGAILNGQFSLNVTVPPLVKCCSAKIRFCIRYTFQFDDCTVCEKVVCYTIKKEGCTK